MNNHSKGQYKRWEKVPPEIRSEIGRKMALKKWRNKTKKERKAHSQMMTRILLKKLSNQRKNATSS